MVKKQSLQRYNKLENLFKMNSKKIIITISSAILLFTNTQLLSSDTNSIAEIRDQIEKLKSENAALKQENQVLRKLVFEKQSPAPTQPVTPPTTSSVSTPPPTPPASPSTPSPARVVPSKPSSAVEYWITTSSGKRHNSGCRYFQTSRGRPGEATEGTACKICGG
jgi:hypothetical protein